MTSVLKSPWLGPWVVSFIAMLTLLISGCAAVPQVGAPVTASDVDGIVEEDSAIIDLSQVEDAEFMVPPWIDRNEVLRLLEDVLHVTPDSPEYKAALVVLDQAYDAGAGLGPELLGDNSDSSAITKSSCGYVRHNYYGSCQDGVVPWGPCAYCVNCDHDWRMLYTSSMSEYSRQGGRWYYIPLNPNAVAATTYYLAAYTSQKYVTGRTSVRWIMIGDRAVRYLFGNGVDATGYSFAVYQELCR